MDHAHHHDMSSMYSTTVSPMGHGDHNHMTTMSDPSGHHGGHGGESSDGECGSGGHDMMMMFFHYGYCERVLFESWRIHNVTGLIASMVGIFILAAFYESIKYYREYLFWRTFNALQYRSVTFPTEKKVVTDDTVIAQPSMLSWMHLFQTVLHVVQIVLSYFLMLIFMTYNVWLCMAVVVGAAFGYFLFGWKKSVIVDVTEHCH